MVGFKNFSLTQLYVQLDELTENIDEVFLLTNGIILMLMQCGFACLEAGSVRTKNVTNILMKNLLDIFISTLAYWLVGYAIAYGEGNDFMGVKFWAGTGIPKNKFANWFFQNVFAATAATIISGAVAERCNFVAYLVYSAVISGIIYPIVIHWVWTPQGWLNKLGYTDFAGAGPVHILGGACSLVGTVLLGPRIGRFDGEEMPGHSTPLIAIGGFILITGFMAFNGGSAISMTGPQAAQTISIVIANTVMAGTGGGLSAVIAARIGLVGPKVWNFTVTLNASLAGMVAVCGAADKLLMWSALLLGILCTPIYIGLHRLIPYLKVDDPLDAVALHLGGGIWGILGGPILRQNGIIYGVNKENSANLLYNFIGIISIITWAVVTSGLMFGMLKAMKCLRVSAEEELKGMDSSKHETPAYPAIAWAEEGPFGWTKSQYIGTVGSISCQLKKIENGKPQTTQGQANQAYLH